jgi:predicted acylesterase/phospholipase RssA
MEDFYKNLEPTSVAVSSGGGYGIVMIRLLDRLRDMGALSKV